MRRTAHPPLALALLAPCALTAVAEMKRARELAKGKAPEGYVKGLEVTIAKWEAAVPR
jgi:hypothetical protein